MVLRLLREAGHEVKVVPTESALRFVGAPTWEALSGHPVSTTVWSDVADVAHVDLGRWAQLVIVAPATADLLARSAAGIADDLLTTSLLTATCPVLMSPAMHTEMWQHPATQANVSLLQSRGIHILPPAVGRLTGVDSGPGRLPEPADIVAAGLALVADDDLAGRRIVISAGGTREPLDPVRYLGNRSSGRQGVALAQRARDRGAEVTLVAAHLDVAPPAGVRVVNVDTAEQMAIAMSEHAVLADVVVMAAAVADFRPSRMHDTKIKKTDADPEAIELVRNPDILMSLTAQRRPGQIFVGFAAETLADADLERAGRDKLQRKGCDILVANNVADDRVFGQPTTEVMILQAGDADPMIASGTKTVVADRLWDVVARRLGDAG